MEPNWTPAGFISAGSSDFTGNPLRSALGLVAAILLGGGCVLRQSRFVPAAANGISPQGAARAALYSFQQRPEESRVNVRVWTAGLRERIDAVFADRRGDVGIEIGVFVNNQSDRAAIFDFSKAELSLATREKRELGPFHPAPYDAYYSDERIRMPGKSARRFLLFFPLPHALRPAAVASYELAWSLELDGEDHRQETLFVDERSLK